MSQNMLKITLKTATLMLLSSGLYACATSQPLISPEMDHYGRIDVSRPEIQVPNSVKPLMDVWLRDTYVNLGHDGYYYMTGTFKSEDRPTAYDSSPGLVLWRSKDLKNWEDLGVIFDLNNIDSWQKDFFIDEKMKRKLKVSLIK